MAYPDELRLEVERYLEELRFTDEPLTGGLEEAMRYSLLAGGKRIRPVLTLATARAIGRDAGHVLPLAPRTTACTARASRSSPATACTRRRSAWSSPGRRASRRASCRRSPSSPR